MKKKPNSLSKWSNYPFLIFLCPKIKSKQYPWNFGCVWKKTEPPSIWEKNQTPWTIREKTKHLRTIWTGYKNTSTWNFGQTLKEWPKNHRVCEKLDWAFWGQKMSMRQIMGITKLEVDVLRQTKKYSKVESIFQFRSNLYV